MSLYLIKRGARPDYHRAPYHSVIICDRKSRADWEAGCTCRRATVWMHDTADESSGWLLIRWQGLAVVNLGVVHGCILPDGSHAGFYHDHHAEPWTLIERAVWWSDRVMPAWVAERGAVYPTDRFTQQTILDQMAEEANERAYRKQLREAEPGTVVIGFTSSGFGRPIPSHWREPQEASA